MWVGGLRLLFAVMAVLRRGRRRVGGWSRCPPCRRCREARQTVLDLARRLTDRSFLRPTAALAGATAALSVGVGFLPVSGAAAGLGTVATGAAVSVLAADRRAGPAPGRTRPGRRAPRPRAPASRAGLLVTAAGLGCAALPGLAGVLLAAALIGAGTGLITPLGFAALAASTPQERLGQTMGAAELGRELGDAGGPLLVAGVATATALTYGYAALAILLAAGPAAAVIGASRRRRHRSRA